MSKYVKYFLIGLLLVLLVLVRFFEEVLFYDPYLSFFKNDYLYIDSPRQEVFKLIAFTSLRYFINSVLSLGVLYLFFNDKSVIKFSSFVYVVAFCVLIIVYFYFVIDPQQENYYFFFNIRRFLIQPVLLLLLLPAFYYGKLTNKIVN